MDRAKEKKIKKNKSRKQKGAREERSKKKENTKVSRRALIIFGQTMFLVSLSALMSL